MPDPDEGYQPASFERAHYSRWEGRGFFRADQGEQPTDLVVLPPIRLTGPLHLGHGLNLILQDTRIRWMRMMGTPTALIPGFNHGGLTARQAVVNRLTEEGELPESTEALHTRLREANHEVRDTIRDQMRSLGISCAWEREAYSLDSSMDHAVVDAFVRLHEEGRILYREKFVPWCSQCGTALSREEIDFRKTEGTRHFIRFRIKGGKKKDYVVVATRRPELLFGMAAIAANPRDERYEALMDKKLVHPLLDREISIIPDDYIDPKAGTGLSLLLPAHFAQDKERAAPHDLPEILTIDAEGRMTEVAGRYAGMDRFTCREQLVEELAELRLLEKSEPVEATIAYCPACRNVVEPRNTHNWFCDMPAIARPCIDAIKEEEVQFVPGRWSSSFIDQMGKMPAWCISRQMDWGRRLPVYTCEGCGETTISRSLPEHCEPCGHRKLVQTTDVFDSWFITSLWPLVVLGWPEETGQAPEHYPSSMAATSPHYCDLWMSRMMILGYHFAGTIPFRTGYINGTVRDETGMRQQKGAGTVDVRTYTESYGADAVRIGLIRQAGTGEDVTVDDEVFESAQTACQNIWAAVAMLKDNDQGWGEHFDTESLSIDDRYLLQYLNRAITQCTESLQKWRFSDYVRELMDFITGKFCDSYLDYAHPILRRGNESDRRQVCQVMRYAWNATFRLLHPIAPFISEELWHQLGFADENQTLGQCEWPTVPGIDESTWSISTTEIDYMDARQDLVGVAQTLREDFGIRPEQHARFTIRPSGDRFMESILADLRSIHALLNAEKVVVDGSFEPVGTMPTTRSKLGTVFMALEGLLDVKEERVRVKSQLEKIAGELEKLSRKLENFNFISKAPEAVIDKHGERKKELLEQRDKLVKKMGMLEG